MVTLREVMSDEVVSVAPTATVAEAAQLMSIHHVGSALVLDADRLVGIFTERDVVRALATDFDASSHIVSAWMTRGPATLSPDATATEALDLMLRGGFRHVPVEEDGHVLGVISIRDLTPRP